MAYVKRGDLFLLQLADMVSGYKLRGGSKTSIKFVDCVEAAIDFIGAHPRACVVFTEIGGHAFRKWRVRHFPISIIFRIEQDGNITLEAVYHHSMDIDSRFSRDILH